MQVERDEIENDKSEESCGQGRSQEFVFLIIRGATMLIYIKI